VFEYRVLWGGISGSKREEVTGRWRKLHNQELHDFYYPPHIFIRVIKLRRTKCNT
jgi:hypothetical protein